MNEEKKRSSVGSFILKLLAVLAILLLGSLAAVGVYVRRGGEIELPQPQKKTVVLLDAGHDQTQQGNVGLIAENEYTVQLCAELEALLLADEENFIVIRTHEAEEDASMETRQARADEADADVIISLHAVYDPFETERTPRIVTDTADSANYKKSLQLAEDIRKQLQTEGINAVIGTYSFKQTHGDYYKVVFTENGSDPEVTGDKMTLLQSQKVPVVSVECVNVNNAEDVAELASEEGIQKTARCIYEALK